MKKNIALLAGAMLAAGTHASEANEAFKELDNNISYIPKQRYGKHRNRPANHKSNINSKKRKRNRVGRKARKINFR